MSEDLTEINPPKQEPTYTDVLNRFPDMHPDLRTHVLRLAGEQALSDGQIILKASDNVIAALAPVPAEISDGARYLLDNQISPEAVTAIDKYLIAVKHDDLDDEEQHKLYERVAEKFLYYSDSSSKYHMKEQDMLGADMLLECHDNIENILDLFEDPKDPKYPRSAPYSLAAVAQLPLKVGQEKTAGVLSTFTKLLNRPDIYAKNPYFDKEHVLRELVNERSLKDCPDGRLYNDGLTYLEENYDAVVAAGYPSDLAKKYSFKYPYGKDNHYRGMEKFEVMRALGNSIKDLQDITGIKDDPLFLSLTTFANDGQVFDLTQIRQDLESSVKQLRQLSVENPDAIDIVSCIMTDMYPVVPRRFVNKMAMTANNLSSLPASYAKLSNPENIVSGFIGQIAPELLVGKIAKQLTVDQRRELASQLAGNGDTKYVLGMMGMSDDKNPFAGLGLEQSLAEWVLQNPNMSLEKLQDALGGRYSFTAEQLCMAEDAHIAGKQYPQYLNLILQLPEAERPRASSVVMELFANYASGDSAALIKAIINGTPHNEKAALGITETGEAGIQELKRATTDFMADLRNIELSDETMTRVQQSLTLRNVLKSAVRYESSSWGDHGDDELKQLLAYIQTAANDGRIEPTGPEYTASQTLEITKLSAQKEKPQWTEDLLGRYGALYDELRETEATLSGSKTPFSDLVADLRAQIINITDGLNVRLQDDETLSPLGRENIARRHHELLGIVTPPDEARPDHYPLRSLANFERNFRSLARHDELHPAMRKIVFAWAMRQHPESRQDIKELSSEPYVEDVSKMREFVEHIVNQETFDEYFSDKKSASMFRKMTSAKALEAGLLRTQGVGVSRDTVPVQFVPTRGAMMELSGHIADSCWASRYRSIAESMPNMTAVIIKQNPDDPIREKLIGAGMLIETTSESGQPLLLIRGLNPQETFINRVSVEDFYEKFVAYARDIAVKQERQLAVVIDNHAGGAASNRPVLFGFLAGKRLSLERVTVNRQDTYFNDYDVSRNSYLL